MKTNKTIYTLILLLAMLTQGYRAYGQADSLQHYLQEAATHNPGIQAEWKAYQASQQKIAQAAPLPDLQLDMGFYVQPMDIIDGKQIADFTLMQMFPWFGTRKAAQSEATYSSNAAFESYRAALNELFLEVYTQWYEMSNLQQRQSNIEAHQLFLKDLESLAIQQYSTSGNANSSTDISAALRVRLEMLELENEAERIQSQLKTMRAAFNALLNRDPHSPLVIPDSVSAIPFHYDEAQLTQQATLQNPDLQSITQQQKAYQAKAKADKKASLPMIGIGLQYSLIGKRSAQVLPTTSMNGMDMLMPMVSLSLPIYRKRYKAEQRESNLWRESLHAAYQQTYNQIHTELIQLRHELDEYQRAIKLLDKQTELAQTTYQLIVSEYATGKSQLNEVIEVQRQLLDYQFRQSEAVAQYNIAVARIQKLITFNHNN